MVYDRILKLAITFQDVVKKFTGPERKRGRVQIVENLKKFLKSNPSAYKDMYDIEQSSFEKYDFDYTQTLSDMKDDFVQPGANGVGLVSADGKLLGYIYGYNMTDDELPDVDPEATNEELKEEYGVELHADVPENFLKELIKLSRNKKVFYIANLALPTQKLMLMRMISTLLKKLKAGGYEYITFDALADSVKLFMGQGGVPDMARMAAFGVKIVATLPQDDQIQALLKI